MLSHLRIDLTSLRILCQAVTGFKRESCFKCAGKSARDALQCHVAHNFATPLGFFVRRGIDKNNKIRCNTLIFFISGLCVLIFLALSCNLVLWSDLYKKLRTILLCFSIPVRVKRKPTWWWREYDACKITLLSCYDVT